MGTVKEITMRLKNIFSHRMIKDHRERRTGTIHDGESDGGYINRLAKMLRTTFFGSNNNDLTKKAINNKEYTQFMKYQELIANTQKAAKNKAEVIHKAVERHLNGFLKGNIKSEGLDRFHKDNGLNTEAEIKAFYEKLKGGKEGIELKVVPESIGKLNLETLPEEIRHFVRPVYARDAKGMKTTKITGYELHKDAYKTQLSVGNVNNKAVKEADQQLSKHATALDEMEGLREFHEGKIGSTNVPDKDLNEALNKVEMADAGAKEHKQMQENNKLKEHIKEADADLNLETSDHLAEITEHAKTKKTLEETTGKLTEAEKKIAAQEAEAAKKKTFQQEGMDFYWNNRTGLGKAAIIGAELVSFAGLLVLARGFLRSSPADSDEEVKRQLIAAANAGDPRAIQILQQLGMIAPNMSMPQMASSPNHSKGLATASY